MLPVDASKPGGNWPYVHQHMGRLSLSSQMEKLVIVSPSVMRVTVSRVTLSLPGEKLPMCQLMRSPHRRRHLTLAMQRCQILLAEQKTDTPPDTALANSDGKRGMESTSLPVPLKQQGTPAMVRAAAPIRHLLIHSQAAGTWVMHVRLPALPLTTATGQVTCNYLPVVSKRKGRK